MIAGGTERGLSSVQFGESREELLANLRREYPQAILEPVEKPYPKQLHEWTESLCRYLEGALPVLDVPVDVPATPFQMRVWKHLQSIPYGEVRTYAEIAAALGSAARAVGHACAANRVAVVIPCHRVVRGDGGLGGYRWGLDRKRALIDRERAASGQAQVLV
jgi:AraC family transcriptional regulator of adaptative response/methylated-DNA-[protein]-cysteine methyltransferase